MPSPATQGSVHVPRRKFLFRRLRRAFLFSALAVVSFWGFLAWRADHFTFAWTRPFAVGLIAIVGPGTDLTDEENRAFFGEFLSTAKEGGSDGSAAGISRWLEREARRHGAEGPMPPVQFNTYGPIQITKLPPFPPSADLPLLDRWRRTREFLGFFRQTAGAAEVPLASHDATVFVYFYGENEAAAHEQEHSVATRRERLGIVFAPRERRRLARHTVLVAHELLHTLGATDKYVGERSIYPHGYANPGKEPLLPQESAEIMALGIPILPGFEVRVDSLAECVLGRKTAEEIGWLRPAP